MLQKRYYDFNTPHQKNISVYYISQNTNIVNYLLMKILLLKIILLLWLPFLQPTAKLVIKIQNIPENLKSTMFKDIGLILFLLPPNGYQFYIKLYFCFAFLFNFSFFFHPTHLIFLLKYGKMLIEFRRQIYQNVSSKKFHSLH